MRTTAVRPRPRPLWLTIPLYVVLLAVLIADVWASVFWVAVGGSLGLGVAGAAALVVVLAAGLLATDARRQWRLHRSTAGDHWP